MLCHLARILLRRLKIIWFLSNVKPGEITYANVPQSSHCLQNSSLRRLSLSGVCMLEVMASFEQKKYYQNDEVASFLLSFLWAELRVTLEEEAGV